MWVKTIASQALRTFADERRRVVSDWRILIHCRRLAHAANGPLPHEKKAIEVRKELLSRGDLEMIPGEGLSGIYLIVTPFANLLDVSEEQLLQEADPWAVLSHLTALTLHGLTDLIPTQIFATVARTDRDDRQVPLGTTAEDWIGLNWPISRRPARVRHSAVTWTEVKNEWFFGVEVGYSLGAAVYVTDRERTLIDALRSPDKSGGIAKVFEAWKRADAMNVDRLVDYTDRFDNQILRQRVGFLLEALQRPNPRRDRWRKHLVRGGSVRLAAGEPYDERFAADWNLSLNVPESVLAILNGE
jgi:predicted transcriptional regulator of viral defense system